MVLSTAKAAFKVVNDGMDIKQASVYLKYTADVGREERKRIYQLLGLTTVTNGQTKANIGLTASLKTLTSGILKMAAAWATSPLGVATIAVAGVYAIIKAYDHLSSASERAIEKHKELASEYDETKAEIESLEEQIASTNAKIKELEDVDSPELVNQAEISKLEASVELMNKQLEIKKRLLEFENAEKAEAASDALTKRNLQITGNAVNYDTGIDSPIFEYKNILEQVEAYQADYDQLQKMISDSYTELATLEPGTKLYESLESNISNLENQSSRLENDILLFQKDISELYKSLVHPDGSPMSGYEGLVERIEIILGIGIDEETVNETKKNVEDLKSKFESDLGLINVDAINTEIDSVQSGVASLSASLTKLSDGSITLEEVIDLIQEFPELAEYVDLTAEGFGDLDKGLQKLIRHAPDDLIDELQKLKETRDLTDKQKESIDDLCASMEKLSTDAIKDATGEFGLLAEAINGSKRAKTELDKALAEDDYDANFEDRIEAFKGLQEVLKSGEVGSKAFDAYKEYFNIEDLDSAGVKQWIKDNNKYFKDGQSGVKAFMKEIERLNNAGILSEDVAYFDSATNTFGYDITQLEYLGELFGWSGEMFQDFVGKYRMYSEDFVDRTTEMTQKELLLQGVIKDLGGITIASMEDLQSYTGYTEDGVKNLVSEMNALNEAVNSELASLSVGGNVDLNLRPQIDTSELLAAGWEEEIVGEAGNIATVFSSTFSNKAGNVAINFTPIQVDGNGNYVGVLDPSTFEEYCEGVIEGVHGDYLNLQIGAEYTGWDAIKQAETAANRIHELHEMLRASGEIKILGVDDINITQSIVDSMAVALGSVEEVKAALVDLSNTKGVTFDAEIIYNGQSIHDILAEEKGKSEDAVTVDIKMNVNDEEVIASVTATAAELDAILGKDWQINLDSADAEEKAEVVGTLIDELPEKTTLTVNGRTYNATNGLKGVLDLISQVKANSNLTVAVNYTSAGSPYKNYGANESKDNSAWKNRAKGTRYDDGGVALLGDEYSRDGSPKPELVISDGVAYVAGQDGPELVNLKRGDQVLTADETKRVLSGNPAARKAVVPAFATGAGGFLAGSLAEQRYLEQQAKKKAEEKKKAEAAAKQKAAAQKKAAQTSGSSAYWSNQKNTSSSTSASSKDNSAYWTSPKSTSSSSSAKYTEDLPGGSTKWSGSGGGSGSGSGSSSSSDSSKNEKSQFEKDYEYRQHLLAMEKLDYEEYIDWLEDAYKKAYKNGEIELEDYRKYAEEVYEGQKQVFQDSIADIEHKIKGLEREPGNEQQIINYYNQIISKIDKEIAAARARGLNDDDDYIQELVEQKWDYADEIKDVQEEIKENAMDAVEDLIDYRIDMLKQDIENEKDAANDKLDTLKDFYDKQKKMLQDVYDEEKYLEEQSEKRKTVDDIRAEMDMLKFDDSAKAQKRLKELQEELKDAEKDLTDFEKDHALENATDLLDKMYEQQEKQIQSEIDALDERLNDPEALYNQALRDIQNNTLALYEEMLEYNRNHGDGRDSTVYDMWTEADKSLDAYFKAMGQAYKNILLVDAYKPTGYASGTSNATPGIHELFEGNKDEYVLETSDGHRYKMFSGLGKKVLNASATDFLYKFANNGEAFISNMINGMLGSINNVSRPTQQIQLSTGDVIVQGNATAETVSAIRRAQRDNIDFVLREFTRLNR